MRTPVLCLFVVLGAAGAASGEHVFGSFAYQVGSGPQALAEGDLNDDGHPDLVAANRYTNDVSVLLNLGDGTYTDPVTYDMGNDPTWIGIADLNDDDLLDVVTTNVDSEDVTIRFNEGGGTLGPVVSLPLGNSPMSAALADLDGDDHPDLAITVASGSDQVTLLMNDGAGGVTARPR